MARVSLGGERPHAGPQEGLRTAGLDPNAVALPWRRKPRHAVTSDK
jgi:hypothetical protein